MDIKHILKIVLRQLQAQGFRPITLAVGYMAELIQAYFGDGGCRIRDYVEKPSFTHMGSMRVYSFKPVILDYIRIDSFDIPDKKSNLTNRKPETSRLPGFSRLGKAPHEPGPKGELKSLRRLLAGHRCHENYARASREFSLLAFRL